MSKILFAPFRAFAGIVAGFVGKKAFERVWGAFDNQQAPDPKQRQVKWQKLVAALLLEGAIFRAVRGLFDHGSRRLFRRLTGRWPGEEHPDSS